MSLRRLLTLVVIVAAIVLLWRERAWFTPEEMKSLLADHPWAPLAFVALHILASLAFVPRLLMTAAAGMLFGLWAGLFWGLVGSMAGAWVGFELARALGPQSFGFMKLPRLTEWLGRLDRGGWRAVWGIRLLPLPNSPVNYAFGLSGIRRVPYLFGSFLGFVPTAVVAIAIGAAGNKALTATTAEWLGPLLLGVVGLGLSVIVPRLPFVKRRLQKPPPPENVTPPGEDEQKPGGDD